MINDKLSIYLTIVSSPSSVSSWVEEDTAPEQESVHGSRNNKQINPTLDTFRGNKRDTDNNWYNASQATTCKSQSMVHTIPMGTQRV